MSGQKEDQTRAKHHLIPASYQRGFTENGKIGVWQRDNGAVRSDSPLNVAATKGFYTYTAEDGTECDDLEKLFSKLEGKAMPIIAHINTLFPPALENELKDVLAYYIAAQYVRTASFRRTAELLGDQIAKLDLRAQLRSRKNIIETLKRNNRVATEEKIRIAERLVKYPHSVDVVPDKGTIIRIYLDHLPRAAQTFLDRPWRVVLFQDQQLITSDSPLLLIRDEMLPIEQPVNLTTAKEVVFPLSSTRLLIMGRTGRVLKERLDYGKHQIVHELNELQLQNSYIEAYGPPSVIALYRGEGMGARPLLHMDTSHDEDFFAPYNRPPKRLRPQR